MEYDLTHGLRDLSRTPPVTPLPAEPVVRRVRRGRAIRTVGVGLASASLIIGAAVVVYAAPWDATPAPPATPSPTPTPTPDPSPPTGPLFDATTMDNLFLPVETLTGIAPALGDLGNTWSLDEWNDIPDGAEFLPEARCKPAMTIVYEAPSEYAHRGHGAFSQEIVLLADREAASEAFADLADALETCDGWAVDLGETHGAWWAIDEATRGAEGFSSIRVTGVMQGEGHESPWIEVDALIGNAILRIGAVYTDTSPASANADAAALEAMVQNHLATVAAGPLVPREDPPIVALTTTGDLVFLDPETGAILGTHPAVADETPFGPAWVSTDQTFAYVVRDGEVRRVGLVDGGVEVVAPGYAPAVSPDGRLLAYIGPDESGEQSGDTLWLVDQESGTRYSLNPIAATELELPRPSWSRDGATLYLWYDLEPDIVAVPVAANGAPLTDAVTTIRAPRAEDGYATEFWSLATGLPDGGLAHVSAPEAYDIPSTEISVRRLDPATGASSRIEELSGADVVGLAAPPEGDSLLAVVATREADTVRYTLVWWDPLQGMRTLADDIVAVAW